MTELYCGDCLEVMKTIPDKSVDLILCDLPFGVTSCEWDCPIPFDKLWEAYNRIIKANGAILLFGTEPFSTKLRMSNMKNYRYDWYWEKNRGVGFQYSHVQPLRAIENVMVFYDSAPYYDYCGEKHAKKIHRCLPIVKSNVCNLACDNGDKRNRKYKDFVYRTKTNILKFNRIEHPIHPTQKPVALLEYLIKTYTKEGETVLDNCMGSGSTGVACVNTKRRFIGIELDKRYYDIACKRINGEWIEREDPEAKVKQMNIFEIMEEAR